MLDAKGKEPQREVVAITAEPIEAVSSVEAGALSYSAPTAPDALATGKWSSSSQDMAGKKREGEVMAHTA